MLRRVRQKQDLLMGEWAVLALLCERPPRVCPGRRDGARG